MRVATRRGNTRAQTDCKIIGKEDALLKCELDVVLIGTIIPVVVRLRKLH